MSDARGANVSGGGGLDVRTEALGKTYRLDGEDVEALHNVHLDVPAGSSAAVLGPSGSGKSTLMTLLAGLQRPTEGTVHVGDQDLGRLSERRLLRVRAELAGVVVQNPVRNLLPYADAVDNVRFAQRGARGYGRREFVAPHELLERLGLSGVIGTAADRLSGGERQRLALAVGIANSPGVLLADEPTSQLDHANRDEVLRLVARVGTEFGTTIILVTHDAVVAEAMQQTITLHEGRVV